MPSSYQIAEPGFESRTSDSFVYVTNVYECRPRACSCARGSVLGKADIKPTKMESVIKCQGLKGAMKKEKTG